MKEDEMDRTFIMHGRNEKFTPHFSQIIWNSVSLGEPRYRQGDNTKKDLKDIWCESVEWIHQTKDRDKWQNAVNTMIMNLWVP